VNRPTTFRFGDEVDDLHVHVGERGPEWGDPPPGAGDEVGGVHVVDDVQPAGVHDLVDQPAHDRLVRSGAGSIPASLRISHTVEAATSIPRTSSSPWMRR
jgi:hypothetical protein